MGTDPDYVYIYGPDGKLQVRLEITTSTTTSVTLLSGNGVYKILHVNYTYIHTYTLAGMRPMVVEPFSHRELLRALPSADLYFHVPENTPSFTFHAHTVWNSDAIQEELYDPLGTLVHTFVLPPNTFQEDYTVMAPMPGFWRCRFINPTYGPCGAWVDGVPNYFSSSPSTWFEPKNAPGTASIVADVESIQSIGARVGVNWWINPSHQTSYAAERDAVQYSQMDTARLTVDWAWREPSNDNADPFHINWQGFSFSGHDDRMAAYQEDIVSQTPDAMPVLLFYWSPNVSWQPNNPASWTETQREEFAEFVLATMIHTVAPDLQTPPDPGPAYDFTYVELLNEPNLTMGSGKYQEYFEILKAVGQRLKGHPDPRINSLKVVASGIGWTWGQGNLELENWVGKLIDQADPWIDGVNWHRYEYLHIEECGRFEEDIEKVKTWLETRGDLIPDEEILMTEMNQHGGSPTVWQRQDTYYASRWWFGACLSALRGGVNFIHYYQLVDDPPYSYNYKGMMFNDGPYEPPYFPGGPPHGAKPVLEATRFLNEHRLDQVVSSHCDHSGLAHLVTKDIDQTSVTILLANLFDRMIDTALKIDIPLAMQGKWYSVMIYELGKERKLSQDRSFQKEKFIKIIHAWSSKLSLKLELKPLTLYAIVFQSMN
jgi:hypothetical protein